MNNLRKKKLMITFKTYNFFSLWIIQLVLMWCVLVPNTKWKLRSTYSVSYIHVASKKGQGGQSDCYMNTGVDILHKICNCSKADRNCSGALQRNLFADNWKGFIAFCWNCYFYHTWFRFLLLSEMKSGNSNRFVWKLVINTFILDLLCKVECLANVLASKLNLSTILLDSYLLLLEDSAFQLLNI